MENILYASLQLVMPNEVARAHPHTVFLLYKSSSKELVPLQAVTSLCSAATSAPKVWLDGLVSPTFRHLPVHFVKYFDQSSYPAGDVDSNSSPLEFPWVEMRADLMEDGREGPVGRVLGGGAERISAGVSSPCRCETTSAGYYAMSGQDRSVIELAEFMEKQSGTALFFRGTCIKVLREMTGRGHKALVV
ncbi:hypothetical protein F1880_010050 [Penicillium rolfsii]|nr:hypothetical protein F1880_010050 [Penicillium rolfsii]